MDDLRFRTPLYSVSRAARMVGMPSSTLRTWSQGYAKHFSDRPSVVKGPVITSLAPRDGSGETIPFVGLVEATVVQAFRKTDLPMQRIRRAVEVLTAQGELEHALASRKLYTDGADVLYDYGRREDDGLSELTVVRSGQRVFRDVIDQYLRRITFGDDWATELVLPITPKPLLRVRPAIAGGEPLFISSGAPLSAVVSRHAAGEKVSSIARDFDLRPSDVQTALRALGDAA